MKKQSKILASQEFAVFCFTLAVVLAFVLLSTSFATVANFCLILSQVSINGICAAFLWSYSLAASIYRLVRFWPYALPAQECL